jgi:hypothetical protein
MVRCGRFTTGLDITAEERELLVIPEENASNGEYDGLGGCLTEPDAADSAGRIRILDVRLVRFHRCRIVSNLIALVQIIYKLALSLFDFRFLILHRCLHLQRSAAR